MNILIMKDSARPADILEKIVADQKYLMDVVCGSEDGVEYARTGRYDVIVLDIEQPKAEDFEVVYRLRESHCVTPVLVLSGKQDVQNCIKALDSGADDYMSRPFVPEELLARLRALSRRQGPVIMDELKYEDLVLNLNNSQLTCGDKSVHLSFKEYEVLKLLITSTRLVVSKDELIDKIWGSESGAEDNNVEVYISFLRKKLRNLESRVNIGTIRKMGYHLEVLFR
ncbi:MAG: response regulator transcription factor [Clostridia bacterium]|nr:response regulator transcription factor [Clostridia bacterium]